MQKDSLGLKIPEQINAQTTELALAAIQQWLSNLQTADLVDAMNQVIVKLDSLNIHIIEPDQRFNILELFQPLIKSSYESLKKRYLNQTQPLSIDKINIIELSRNIHKSILTGYKIIVEDVNLSNNSSFKKNILPNTIYRCFKHFNKILDSYYQSYTEYEEKIWQEIHIVYKYAKECKITNHEVTVDQNQYTVKLETITPYKQALFVACTSPYEWRQTDQQVIYNYGLLWNEHIILRDFKDSDLNNKIGMFFIPFNEDVGIMSFYLNKTFSSDDGLTLDLIKLIEYLKSPATNKLANLNPNDPILANYNLTKLIKRINEAGKRRQERFNILGNVFLTCGFPATHYHINKKINFNPENIGSESDNHIEELELGTSMLEESSSDPDKSFKTNTALYNCRLINIHGEGAGIMFEEIAYPPIQPIEIIAMTIVVDNNSEKDQTCWNIGIIRWLKHNKQGKLMAGIEIFAPFAIAAAVQLTKDKIPVGYFQRAFLFQDNTKNQFNIITPTVQFETNKVVKIYSFYHKKFVETKLQQELFSNNNFKCFAVDLKLPTNIGSEKK